MYRDRAIAMGRRVFFLSFAGDTVKILSFSPLPLQTEICEAAPLVEKLGRLIGQSPQTFLSEGQALSLGRAQYAEKKYESLLAERGKERGEGVDNMQSKGRRRNY